MDRHVLLLMLLGISGFILRRFQQHHNQQAAEYIICDCGCEQVMRRGDMVPMNPASREARTEYLTPACYRQLYGDLS